MKRPDPRALLKGALVAFPALLFLAASTGQLQVDVSASPEGSPQTCGTPVSMTASASCLSNPAAASGATFEWFTNGVSVHSGSTFDVPSTKPGPWKGIVVATGQKGVRVTNDWAVTFVGITNLTGPTNVLSGSTNSYQAQLIPETMPDQPVWTADNGAMLVGTTKGLSVKVAAPEQAGTYTIKGSAGTSTESLPVQVIRLELIPDKPLYTDSDPAEFKVKATPEDALTVDDATWEVEKEDSQPANHVGRFLGDPFSDTRFFPSSPGKPYVWGGKVEKIYWYGYGKFSLTEPPQSLSFRSKPKYTVTAKVKGKLKDGTPFEGTATTNVTVQLDPKTHGEAGMSAYVRVKEMKDIQLTKISETDKETVFRATATLPDEEIIVKYSQTRVVSKDQYKDLIELEENFHRMQWIGKAVPLDRGGCGDLCRNQDVAYMLSKIEGVKKIGDKKFEFERIVVEGRGEEAEQNAVKEVNEVYNAGINMEILFSVRYVGGLVEHHRQRHKVMEWEAKKDLFKQAWLYYFSYFEPSGGEDELNPVNEDSQPAREAFF